MHETLGSTISINMSRFLAPRLRNSWICDCFSCSRKEGGLPRRLRGVPRTMWPPFTKSESEQPRHPPRHCLTNHSNSRCGSRGGPWGPCPSPQFWGPKFFATTATPLGDVGKILFTPLPDTNPGSAPELWWLGTWFWDVNQVKPRDRSRVPLGAVPSCYSRHIPSRTLGAVYGEGYVRTVVAWPCPEDF